MDQDKGSLIKQNERLCVEAKKNKIFIFYFLSAGEVQPLPRKQGFLVWVPVALEDKCHNKECTP